MNGVNEYRRQTKRLYNVQMQRIRYEYAVSVITFMIVGGKHD